MSLFSHVPILFSPLITQREPLFLFVFSVLALLTTAVVIGANILVVGSTRSGKSVGELVRLIEIAEKGNAAIICLDPHNNSLGWKLLTQLDFMGLSHRITFDRLSDLSRVLGWSLLTPSKARNELQRQAENVNNAGSFTGILLRRRGGDSIAGSPLLEEWVMAAIMLYLEQNLHLPLTVLKYAFQPNHRVFKHLLEHCKDQDIRDKFSEIATGVIKPSITKPAVRLLSGLASPVIATRCGKPTFDLGALIERKGILIVEAGSKGNVSEDAQRTFLGAISLQVINYLRGRSREYPRTAMALDEANNAALVTGAEVRAAAEMQKMGLDLHILVQLLDFPSAHVTKGIMTNCVRHEYFYNASADVANVAKADLGKEDYGSDIDIRKLHTGERWVVEKTARGGRKVWKEKVEMPEDPWIIEGLSDKHAEAAIKRIQARDEYHSPEEAFSYQQQVMGHSDPKLSAGDQGDAEEHTDPDWYDGDF